MCTRPHACLACCSCTHIHIPVHVYTQLTCVYTHCICSHTCMRMPPMRACAYTNALHITHAHTHACLYMCTHAKDTLHITDAHIGMCPPLWAQLFVVSCLQVDKAPFQCSRMCSRELGLVNYGSGHVCPAHGSDVFIWGFILCFSWFLSLGFLSSGFLYLDLGLWAGPFPLSLALHSTLSSCFSTSSPFLFLWLHFSALSCVLWKSLFVALCSGLRTTRPILGMATRACCMEPPWRPGAVQLRRECTCSSGPLSCCRWLHGQGHIPPDLCPGSSSAG